MRKNTKHSYRKEEINTEHKIKPRKELKINKEIQKINIFFSLIFLGLISYFIYFQVTQASTIIKNPYNKRQDAYREEIVRGKIFSSKGKTLAYTQVDEDGKETRVYPYKNLFAHVVGFDTHGQSGLELVNNMDLLTSSSNSIDKIFADLNKTKLLGDNITTTLNVNLQKAAYDALGEYKGATVCIDPKTGKILAMVSKSDFDPNNIDTLWSEFNSGNTNNGELVNRATQGKYTPGSVFKIFTTLEYMRTNTDYNKFNYNCTGQATFDTKDNYTIRCYYGEVHGEENLENAFANSCNSAFATIGSKLDGEKFEKFGEEMLFNTKLPISIISNQSSLKINKNSSLFDKTQTAIGQGQTTVSPFHMALISSAIANNGVLMKPYLVEKITSASEKLVKSFEPEKYKDLLTKDEAKTLSGYMRAVVTYGTAADINTDAYEIYGKTGTAQVNISSEGGADKINSWFVGYVIKDKKKIAVATVLENIPEGTGTASYIVKNMLDSYFNMQ